MHALHVGILYIHAPPSVYIHAMGGIHATGGIHVEVGLQPPDMASMLHMP